MGTLEQLADAVDVSEDEVAVHAVADAQRSLDIDDVARGEQAEVGLRERFGDHVKREALGPDFGDGQADAVDGDAFAGLDVGPCGREVESQKAGACATEARRAVRSTIPVNIG